MSSRELGHVGQLAIYEQPGVADYRDTWLLDPGVDDYWRETREIKKQRFANDFLHMQSDGQFHIWPNATMSDWRILMWHPHGVGMTESWRQYQVDKNAPKLVKDAKRRYVMRYCGPAGITESDDMENWNYAHPASLGMVAQRFPYNFQLGLPPQPPG